jgi:hypothetical protein
VTGLRALAGAALSGEWELHRTRVIGRRTCDGDDSNVCKGEDARTIREDARSVSIMARDSAVWLWRGGFWWL